MVSDLWFDKPAASLHPRPMRNLTIARIDHLALGYAPYRWPFAIAHHDEIAAHFAESRRSATAIWNGRILLMREPAIADATLHGSFFATDYADFLAWRDWDFPDRTVVNCFAMGAMRTSDGAYLMGVMGDRTANPGRIYFPAGTPDEDDIKGDGVDLLGNVLREVAEETGLAPQDYTVADGWTAIVAETQIALMKSIAVPARAEELRNTTLRHLASEPVPELSDIRIVRSVHDFHPKMPDLVTAYLTHLWAGSAQ
jgi:8-oxo-dGTP pyrophosphatase MutT (NUDIX family)